MPLSLHYVSVRSFDTVGTADNPIGARVFIPSRRGPTGMIVFEIEVVDLYYGSRHMSET
jgi:hypothetical protein